MPPTDRPILEYQVPPQRATRVRTPGEELFKLAALSCAFIVYGNLGDPEKFADLFFLIGWPTLLGVGIAWIRMLWATAHFPAMRRWFRASWVFVVVSVISTLILIPIGSCPHGTTWRNKWFGVAYSTNGGPCHVKRGRDGRYCWNVGGNWYLFLPPP